MALGARGGQPVVAALRAEQVPAVRLRLEECERLPGVHLHVLVAHATAEHPVAAVADEAPTCDVANPSDPHTRDIDKLCLVMIFSQAG